MIVWRSTQMTDFKIGDSVRIQRHCGAFEGCVGVIEKHGNSFRGLFGVRLQRKQAPVLFCRSEEMEHISAVDLLAELADD